MAGSVDRLREICATFPEVTERLSHGAPTWFVRDKRSFVTLWADGHHDFRPPYVRHRGWVWVRLDVPVDWSEIAELCADGYRSVAPKRLADRVE